MWREYLRATEDQGLGYLQLKMMARNSLEYAFIAGASLWSDAQKLTPVSQCALDQSTRAALSTNCRNFLEGNDRARLEWELERSFAEFEKEYDR